MGVLSVDQVRGAPAQRRRGRPQRLPYETTPLSSDAVDPERRVAWMLAANRLLSPSTKGMSRAAFVERVRERGITVDSSRISRWESGQMAVNQRVLEAYEAVIGLPAGTLWAAHNLVRRCSSAEQPERAQRTNGGSSVEELDELFDMIEARTANGGHWLRMTDDLIRFERIYMHRTTWVTLCTQLLSELTRSSGIAYARRYEAACALLAHPQARGHLTKSLGRFVMHPDAQNLVPSISLLREVGDGAAGSLLLRMMSEDNRLLRRGAGRVAASVAARGLFPPGSEEVLEQHAGYELTRRVSLARRSDAIELAVHLPAESYSRLLAAIPEPRVRRRLELARETKEVVPKDLGRAVSEGVASFAEATTDRAAHDPDLMLRRLVREALFHVHRERRHQAAVLLGVSPYGRGAVRAILKLTRDPDDLVATMSWALLERMGHLLRREELADHVFDESRPEIRARGVVALGLAAGSVDDAVADELKNVASTVPPGATRHAAVFALGMMGHDHLVSLQRVEDHARPAGWWRALGSAIHDDDVPCGG